jgi:ABC-type bacteriocin/lantibiotic exporter with double-glycine peptidase domain
LAVSGRLSGLLLELINGIAKLRVSGTENRAFASWARSFARQKKLSVQSRTLGAALTVFYSVFPVLGSILIFYAMARLTEGQEVASLTTGEFLAFTTAFGQFQAAALELSGAFLSVLGAVPLYERAKPILDALPEVSAAKMHPGELSGNIEVKHVDFRYRADTPLVLRDVSVKIPAGRFVAFVGPSGSGKSTLLRLLLGFETSESGSVYFDDQDLTGLDIQAVRQQIGVVLQNGRLAPGSIFENIVGSAPLTMEEAVQAARLAGLEDDIRAMPMGMHTMVAEGGVGLSGGQRQRLMIARAIVRRPRIIFFDEATSALDNETQSIVSRSLESLQATRVVIAHRLSTIINADYIYLMEKGAVVQEGRYEDLIHREGPFAELARRQIV